jgi:tRNA threonylcarbamoyladenosine modification (KEOPS) complex  Pcc1 subunit
MISDDLYARLNELVTDDAGTLAAVFDTKRPGNVSALKPIAVFSEVSDVASERTIDGKIALRDSRWQISIYAEDLGDARAAKETVIAKLHGYTAESIEACRFESAPGVIYESDLVPPEYHLPVDFTVTQ